MSDRASHLRIERLSGPAIVPYLPALARLRIAVFREFPYLYDGSVAYEERYLQTYARSTRGVMVTVFDGEEIVGASSGLPLADETPEVQRPFLANGFKLEEVFYFGESVLLRPYRGCGLGVRFFQEREAHARALGGFRWTSFCAVQRPVDHPRRPADYVPLDAFWEKRGYRKHPELNTEFVWQDLDESEPSPKPMTFWLKPLEER
ncbi:MAG TPA: GNAT family N-acetyltransferase [Candidatus Competibacteraceae bacterium]|nr:GNAT family N-acetyltransferase [Candidatus Competibacteraceae bacterium]